MSDEFAVAEARRMLHKADKLGTSQSQDRLLAGATVYALLAIHAELVEANRIAKGSNPDGPVSIKMPGSLP